MGLDMAKYRRIFLEESNDHLAEISRALLDLEKEMASVEAIDTIFRMAHSIKSMAASLGYDSVADLSHRMEDRMEGVRSAGCVRNPAELGLLFRSLETLEAMVGAIANEQEPTSVDQMLLDQLAEDVPGASAAALAEASDPPDPAPVAPDAVGGEPKKA
jgi:two-component system, chemotaxis family, sensor kinase CheA